MEGPDRYRRALYTYWRRTSPRATLWSMIGGVSAALVWQAWSKLGLPELPPALAGVHGFVVGTVVGLVIIAVGTFLGKAAPRDRVERAWGLRRAWPPDDRVV